MSLEDSCARPIQLKAELDSMIEAEKEYTANQNPQPAAIQSHNYRLRRFQEILLELAELARQIGH